MNKETVSSNSTSRPLIKHTPQLRADAAWALMHILEHGMSSRDIMPMVFERHAKATDRAWLQEVVFGVLRVLPTVQSWLRQLLKSPLKKQQKVIEHVIMIGLFQQAFMRTSSHAAVSETVNASKVLKQGQLSGLVNAILRNFEREKLSEKSPSEPHVSVNLPKWLYKQLSQAYPDKIAELGFALQQKPPLWLRINPMVVNLAKYSDILNTQDIAHEVYPPFGIKLNQYTEITKLPMFEEGGFAVQDFAAQQAASLLKVNPDDIVLDACAAPGGKTAAIIEACPEIGVIYAIDSSAQRNIRTHENLARLGHSQRFGLKLKVIDADAMQVKTFEMLPQFDKILLDAPCSATGVIRRHPDIKWHRKASDIETLCQLQSQILDNVWRTLKPGGTLLYATCSILPQENTEQVSSFLQRHKNAVLDQIEGKTGSNTLGWQILPGDQSMDGFFYARLIKSN